VITQSAAATDAVIFLDYALYTATSNSAKMYFINDRDAQIKYTPAWRTFGSDIDFQHASQASTNAGDSLSLAFEGAWTDIFLLVIHSNRLIGTSILFYGGVTLRTTLPNASMSIDGGPQTFWSPPTTATQTNNMIFNSGILSPGNHTLVVTAENDQPVWADYFLVTPNSPDFVSPSITPSASHKKTPVGTIVGPIVGLFALVALVAAIFCRRGRQSESPERESYRSILTLPTNHLKAPMSNVPDLTPFSAYGTSGAAGPPTVMLSRIIPSNKLLLREQQQWHISPSSSGSATSSSRPGGGQELPPYYSE
jgi:hypothetical protein